MKPILLALLLGITSFASVTITTIADVTGDGAAHVLASSGTARWVQVQAANTNATTTCSTSSIAGCVRVGDSAITTSRGVALLPGQSMFFPLLPVDIRDADPDRKYALNTIYYLAQTGDKILISYVP